MHKVLPVKFRFTTMKVVLKTAHLNIKTITLAVNKRIIQNNCLQNLPVLEAHRALWLNTYKLGRQCLYSHLTSNSLKRTNRLNGLKKWNENSRKQRHHFFLKMWPLETSYVLTVSDTPARSVNKFFSLNNYWVKVDYNIWIFIFISSSTEYCWDLVSKFQAVRLKKTGCFNWWQSNIFWPLIANYNSIDS